MSESDCENEIKSVSDASCGAERSKNKLQRSSLRSRFTIVDGKYKCLYCPALLAQRYSTSNLSQHVSRCKGNADKDSDHHHEHKVIAHSSADRKDFDQNVAEKYLLQFMANANINVALVDDPYFKQFVASIQPGFILKSKQTLQNQATNDLFSSSQTMMRQKVKEAVSNGVKFSFNIDFWTSSTVTKSYMVVTINYITVNYQYIHFIVDVLELTLPYTGRYVATHLLQLWKELEVEHNLLCVVIDGGVPIVSTAIDHMLDSIAKQCFHGSCTVQMITAIVEGVLHFFKTDLQMIQSCELGLKALNSLPDSRSELCDCHPQPYSRINPTVDALSQWTSTSTLLNNVLPYHSTLDLYAETKMSYSQIIKKGQTIATSFPRINNWTSLNQLSAFLNKCKDFVSVACDISKPSINNSLSIMCEIEEFLLASSALKELIHSPIVTNSVSTISNGDDDDARPHNTLQQVIQKLYCEIDVYLISHVLDPRYKTLFWFYRNDIVRAKCQCMVKVRDVYNLYIAHKQEGSSGTVSTEQILGGSGKKLSCCELKRQQQIEQGQEVTQCCTPHQEEQIDEQDELELYLAEPAVDVDSTGLLMKDFDVLKYWEQNQTRFPTLAKMARDFLGVPATSIATENVFEGCSNLIEGESKSVPSWILLHSWSKISADMNWHLPTPSHHVNEVVNQQKDCCKRKEAEGGGPCCNKKTKCCS